VRRRQVRIREESRNARAFDMVACNSMYSRESILRSYGVDPRVCYLGVDEQRMTPRRELSRRPFLLTVGAAMAEKNVSFIIRALGTRPDLRWPLVWVANTAHPEHVADMTRLADRLGVPLRILHGVSHEALIELYRRATLFLYSPRLEPFGLAPLEAAACGLPTVAVAEAGVRETVVHGRNGVLVPADPSAFAAATADLLADPQARESLSHSAREYVEERWSRRDAAARLAELLEQLPGEAAVRSQGGRS